MPDIYDPSYVRTLFNEMAATYGFINLISSFGFCGRWRQQCVALANPKEGMTICDMMTGMGECWHSISDTLKGPGEIIALDFSSQMCERALKTKKHYPQFKIKVLEEDALKNTIPSSSVDCVISSFGVKTLSDSQKERFAKEISRLLKPSGIFSLVEISVPKNTFLKLPYMFYLRFIIPIIGKIFLGNPDNYRMLGIYTEKFQRIDKMRDLLKQTGLEVFSKELFFGCATAVWGTKP